MRRAALLLLVACASSGPVDDAALFDTSDVRPPTGDHGDGPGFVVTDGEDVYPWGLPEGFPRPRVPADNPMTEDKVALGRWLFHDPALSSDGSLSCAGCHVQSLAFSDGAVRSLGVTGQRTTRNAPGLQNVAYMTTFTWADPSVTTLADQHRGPLFGTDPVEMGASGHEDAILARLRDTPRYPGLFAAAFPDDDAPISWDRTVQAIASFVRSMVSARAPIDRFTYGGEPDALSPDAEAGMALFFSERLECHHCHGGFQFSRAVTWEGASTDEVAFDNIGLYDVDGAGSYPDGDQGLAEVSGEAADRGRFRPPSLRNVTLTAPYMHDGSVATLDEVLAHYVDGGTVTDTGPNAGDGRANPHKSTLITGFTLTRAERDQLLAFLEALTDEAFLDDPRFASPITESRDTGDDTVGR